MPVQPYINSAPLPKFRQKLDSFRLESPGSAAVSEGPAAETSHPEPPRQAADRHPGATEDAVSQKRKYQAKIFGIWASYFCSPNLMSHGKNNMDRASFNGAGGEMAPARRRLNRRMPAAQSRRRQHGRRGPRRGFGGICSVSKLLLVLCFGWTHGASGADETNICVVCKQALK